MKISAQNSIRYSLFSPNLDHWERRNHRNSVRWTSSWHSIALLHPLEGRGRQDGACILHCPSNSSHDRMLLVSCPFVPVRWWADLVICSFQFKNIQSLLWSSGWAASSWNGRIGPWECTATEQGDNAAAIQTKLCWEWRTCTKRHRISGQGRCTSMYVQDESESISLPPPLKALPFTKANSLCKEMQSASFLLSYILCAAAVEQMFNIAF